MSKLELTEPFVVLDGSDRIPVRFVLGQSCVVAFSSGRPMGEKPNEDALALIPCGQNRAVFAVADGFGGQPAGDQAARIAMIALVESVSNAVSADRELRDAILDGFERANREVTQLGVGAATTLAVAEVDDDHVRSYHAGDSEVVAVGQRGRLKLQTVSHSPVAYGVEAGLIHQDDAIDHVDRNIVSNMVGSPEMRIEIGSPLCLRPRDRLLVATDGVFDNLSFDELVEHIRKGPIDECCSKLTATCHARMTAPKPGEPSKPDDVSMILFSRQ